MRQGPGPRSHWPSASQFAGAQPPGHRAPMARTVPKAAAAGCRLGLSPALGGIAYCWLSPVACAWVVQCKKLHMHFWMRPCSVPTGPWPWPRRSQKPFLSTQWRLRKASGCACLALWRSLLQAARFLKATSNAHSRRAHAATAGYDKLNSNEYPSAAGPARPAARALGLPAPWAWASALPMLIKSCESRA